MPTLPPGLSPEFLEPILKAELSKHKFLNLGGFLLGSLVDATLFGMMIVMLGYWFSYVPKERTHVKIILVSPVWRGRNRSRMLMTFYCGPNPFLLCLPHPFADIRHSTGLGRPRRDRMYRLQCPPHPLPFHEELWQMDAVRHGQV
jgi:hypothetical protein